MKTLNKQQGFTLVELIIVIVILGILAVTAAPRFLNFQGDAKKSVVFAVQGAVKASMALVNGKAIIAGVTNQTPTLAGDADANVAVEGVKLTYGYPKATVAGIKAAIDFPNGWVTSLDAPNGDQDASGYVAEVLTTTHVSKAGKIRLAADLPSLRADGCYVEYTGAFKASQTDAVTTPTVTVVTAGCK